MPIHDKSLVKRLRYTGGALKRNPAKVKIRVAEILAQKYNLPLRTVRYYMFERRIKAAYRTIRDKEYDLEYKRVTRHIDRYLPQIFNNDSQFPVKRLLREIKNLTKISFKESTLENLLLKKKNSQGDSPTIKTAIGNYCLNGQYYNNKNYLRNQESLK